MRVSRNVLIAAVPAIVGLAVADDRPTDDAPSNGEPPTIVVPIGKTVEREVGWAMGHRCDDVTLFDARMRNKDPETNVFVVTGRKVGTTLCRVGTHHIEDRPTFLFRVTVVAPARP